MEGQKKNAGITLVALVVSIVVMLILAGVSINAVIGEDGILTQAQEAKTKTEIATEKEELQYIILDSKVNEATSDSYLGSALYDKTVANGTTWNVVVDTLTGTVYGTGWQYIPKGTNIGEYGNVNYAYVVNYETGEIVSLSDGNFTQLDYTSGLSVTDNLILNIDSSIIEEGADMSTVENQLGSSVELVGFEESEWGDTSGLTTTSFNFDGVDDYIKITYETEEEKQNLAENGFTFEFYGKINLGKGYDYLNNEEITGNYAGIFCYRVGSDYSGNHIMRFGIEYRNKKCNFKWNAGLGEYDSDFSEASLYNSIYYWNIHYVGGAEYGVDHYYTVTLNCNEIYKTDSEGNEYYAQRFYKDGELIYEGGYNVEEWNYFVNSFSNADTITVGVCSMTATYYWWYSQMNAYTLRLYSRGLTEEEVMDNYTTSVAYHALIESMAE